MNEKLELLLQGMELKRFVEREFLEVGKLYDMKKVDIEVLCFLACCHGADTPTEIHRCLKLNRGHVSQAIDTLCRREYILAIPDKEDRRIMHYEVNAKAADVVEGVSMVCREMDRKLLNGVSEEEIRELIRIMNKIEKNMQADL